MSDMTTNDDDDDMRDEYDFSEPGVVGKYYEAYLAWQKRHVVLDPDVASDFPDSESVNRALRRVAKARRRRNRVPTS
jgi:hypothetical protein